MLDGQPFALCLTHDLDRPYKTYQSVYHALRDRRLSHLADVLPSRNPYWQFEEIMELEAALGVRSTFYILNEPRLTEKRLRSWLNPADWIQYIGRYDVNNSNIAAAIRHLDAGGWEIGLHGSYRSYDDRARLRHEKQVLENCLGAPVVGGRQHYLNLSVPETWHHHADIGLSYDASLGSAQTYGFQYGYHPFRPFGDEFVVFPLTLMEQTLPDPSSRFDDAWTACEDLLSEAAANGAVMTALWHPRLFSESDFPGYRKLYRRLVEWALEMGAWVGPVADCYRELDLDRDCVSGYDHLIPRPA